MKPIAITLALLAAGFYGSAEAAITTNEVIEESGQVILASQAAAETRAYPQECCK